MKIAALTMAYRDHWALSQWVAHHGREIGEDNLFIVAHGADAEIARIAPRASVITIPRDDLSGFDRWRGTLLNGIAAGLLGVYDAVIRTDADELICAEGGLAACLACHTDVPVITALGFDLVESGADAPLGDGPVLAQRRHAAFTGHYTKACILNRAAELAQHGVRLPPRRVADFPYCLPEGLFLAHLKYANRAELDATNAWRVEVARAPGKGQPGPAWKEAEADAAKFFAMFEAKRPVSWEAARDEAYAALAHDPVRSAERRLVKAQGARFDTRTRLPDGFAGF